MPLSVCLAEFGRLPRPADLSTGHAGSAHVADVVAMTGSGPRKAGKSRHMRRAHEVEDADARETHTCSTVPQGDVKPFPRHLDTLSHFIYVVESCIVVPLLVGCYGGLISERIFAEPRHISGIIGFVVIKAKSVFAMFEAFGEILFTRTHPKLNLDVNALAVLTRNEGTSDPVVRLLFAERAKTESQVMAARNRLLLPLQKKKEEGLSTCTSVLPI